MSKNYATLGSCMGATSQNKNGFNATTSTTSKNNWLASILLVVSLFFAGFSANAQFAVTTICSYSKLSIRTKPRKKQTNHK